MLRVRDATSPAHTTSERVWFGAYGLLSCAYRLFVVVAIAIFIGAKFFFFGVILALWAVLMMIGMPIVRAVRHLQTRQSLRERQVRILAIASAIAVALLLLATLVPVPQRTQAEGVIWLPERSMLRAGANGFVSRLEVQPGTTVKAGQVLVHRFDPTLDAQIRALQARVAELEASHGVEFVNDRARAPRSSACNGWPNWPGWTAPASAPLR